MQRPQEPHLPLKPAMSLTAGFGDAPAKGHWSVLAVMITKYGGQRQRLGDRKQYPSTTQHLETWHTLVHLLQVADTPRFLGDTNSALGRGQPLSLPQSPWPGWCQCGHQTVKAQASERPRAVQVMPVKTGAEGGTGVPGGPACPGAGPSWGRGTWVAGSSHLPREAEYLTLHMNSHGRPGLTD